MILGIGIDLCRIPRIRRSVERLGEAWIEELFAIEERDRCAASVDSDLAFARGFACKEACAKALGTGFTSGVDPRDIALSEVDGVLTLRLDGGALARLQQMSPPTCGVRFLVTCKHVDDFMSCVVVFEATPSPNARL
ncbi:MAG: holo-ACP synthase [Janthinobacterium lividum]